MTAIVDRWVQQEWNDAERAVITIAEVLAHQADTHRPWWRRRKSTPLDFVPAARESVKALLMSGWRPPSYGRSEP